MSLFKTFIPVNVEEILADLPKNRFVHSVAYDANNKQIVIMWEHDRFQTGLTVPIEYPLELIGKRTLPQGVKDVNRKEKPPEKENAPEVKPETSTPVLQPIPEYIQTKEDFDDALVLGKVLEFQGVTPVWDLVDSNHVFTKGYFYREVEQPKPI